MRGSSEESCSMASWKLLKIMRRRDLARLPGLWKERAQRHHRSALQPKEWWPACWSGSKHERKNQFPKGTVGIFVYFHSVSFWVFLLKKNNHSSSVGFCSPNKTEALECQNSLKGYCRERLRQRHLRSLGKIPFHPRNQI